VGEGKVKKVAVSAALIKIILPVVAVLLVSTAVLNFFIVSRSNAQRVDQLAEQIASSRAVAVNAVVEQLLSQQNSYAGSSEVLRLLEENDTYGIESFSEKYLLNFNSAEKAYLIPVGRYEDFDLRFAEIDMVRKMEKGETVLPEAYQIDGKNFFDVVTAVKVPNSERFLGTLLVTYPVKPLQNIFSQKQEEGKLTLRQQFHDAAAMDVVANNVVGAGAPYTVVTAVPHWSVVFTPSDKFKEKEESSTKYLAVVQGSAVLLCLVLLVVYQMRRAKGMVVHPTLLETPIQIKGAKKIDKFTPIPESGVGTSSEGLTDPLFNKSDVLDLDSDSDFDFDIKPAAGYSVSGTAATITGSQVQLDNQAALESFEVNATIFRDYDIRGNAERDISNELARRIGLAFGSECIAQGQANVVLAGDGRLSTPRLLESVEEGLLQSGCHVISVDNVPTPLMYFATNTLHTQSGIMVTASHNAAADNGFKMVINGRTLSGDQIQKIKSRVQTGDFLSGSGTVDHEEIIAAYIDHIVGDVALAGSYRVVIDCGNGIAGCVAPKLFEELGCEVIPMYCDVDGNFPNHPPDPSVIKNLDDLVARVQEEGADIGIALDGDGDRLTVVTASGKIILPDVLLMLFAKDIVSRNPGTDVIFDVKSTRRLNALISSYGGRPVMWKSGHSHIKNKMQETGALIAGEFSGHIFFKERWFGFDDGMYSAARLLEIMSIRDQDLDGIVAAFPECSSTPEIRIPVDESRKFAIIKQLSEQGEWGNGKLTTMDGVRVDFSKGWGLVRASNTAAELTMRFEADDDESLATVRQVFQQQLFAVDKALNIPN
jgi:phosphomannomutase/phosphoglucomutase